MKPKLISFKLCPFVQRAAMALDLKGVDFDIEYIDLASPADWFLQLSPQKKVPLLLVGEQVLFESTAIVEYIDEAWPHRLHPGDLIRRAQNRGWIEFSSACTWSAFHLTTKESEEEFSQVLEDLWSGFDQLEDAMLHTPFFNGDRLSLVDVAYAPLFQRLEFLDSLAPGIWDPRRHPKVTAWKAQLLSQESVTRSVVSDLQQLYYQLLQRRQGYIAGKLDKNRYPPLTEKRSTY